MTVGYAPSTQGGRDKPKEQPRRKISVGLNGYFKAVEMGAGRVGDTIYVELNYYEDNGIMLSSASRKQFLIRGHSVDSSRGMTRYPIEEIQRLAESNNCDIDYSMAIEQGLKAVFGLEKVLEIARR